MAKSRLRKLVDTEEAMNKFIVDYRIPPNASEEDLTKAKAALTDAIRERDNASAGLAGTQKQPEDQTKCLLEAEDQLRIAKELIDELNKRLIAAEHDKGMAEYACDETIRAKREAEFARNEAEAAKETAEDDEALKPAGVNASFDLWKAENIFYPTAIREATSTSSVAVSDQPEEGVIQLETVQVGASPGETLKGGEPQEVIETSQRTDLEIPKRQVPTSIPVPSAVPSCFLLVAMIEVTLPRNNTDDLEIKDDSCVHMKDCKSFNVVVMI
uniref:Uncharacterized protein n=1 Tax=Quercus lobata TaxID=97700 RepID=A0A7N2M444_QUELO